MNILIGLAMVLSRTQTPSLAAGKITAAYVPQRIAKILPDLSKAVGAKLRVDPALADDVLMIDVADVPSKALLVKIAAVTYGKWVDQDGGLELVSDQAALKDATARGMRERTKEIQGALDDRQPREDDSGVAEDNAVRLLLSFIGANNLAGFEPGTRHVFALQPNARQSSLPHESAAILGRLVTEIRQRNADENSAQPTPAIGQAFLVLQVDHDKIGTELLVGDAAGATLVKSVGIIVVKPKIHLPALHGDPLVIDPTSREFFSRGLMLTPTGQRQSGVSIGVSNAVDGARPAQFNASSAESIERNPKISSGLLARLVDPVGLDPLWIAKDPLIAAARLDNANLVACLPDYAFGPLANALAGEKMDAAGFIQAVAPGAGLNVDESAGWLTVSAREPAYAAWSHVDRAGLGALISAAANRRFLSLEDLATYSLASRNPMVQNGIDDLYLHALNSQIYVKAANSFTEPGLVRIYATLSSAQRNALAAHQPLSLADLSAAQQRSLEFALYNSRFGPMVSQIPAPGEIFVARSDFRTERTEALPSGIPATMQFLGSSNEQPTYWATDSRSGVSSFMTANQLASQMYQRERPELAYLGTPPHFDQFEPIVNESVTLRFELGPAVLLERKLQGSFVPADGKSFRYEDLPDAFRTDVAQRLQNMETALRNTTFGPHKSAAPPP